MFNATQPTTQPTDLFNGITQTTELPDGHAHDLFFQDEDKHKEQLLLFEDDESDIGSDTEGSDTESGKNLCLFCEEEMPVKPSAKLLAMQAELLAMPTTQGRLPPLRLALQCSFKDNNT
ncbi:uncharacterized protein MELLADRAFT_64180 [Melampsora larici-populina 98AG31]|uniref:Uncharacterized protein n=1 Tax=Melampsora larici-populina (strain 98AG31 / pathotype 3-4-7) TaxID=747676 RepID=F4RQA7_MELLP|nr:uncharacterized protein MELLADRAFT_64180 [Melampsora larici-populina 98AG31]EGG05437.1 hypothetical protein MELLADRAFT_64180 [Melampsora larici-populina 98AG31]